LGKRAHITERGCERKDKRCNRIPNAIMGNGRRKKLTIHGGT
jgi:hypothetical protein